MIYVTDRHLHCVYFKFDDPDNPRGRCLLKDKVIEEGFHPCCEYCVLRPFEVLAYFLKHNGYCEDWGCADTKARQYLEKVGFNNYPRQVKRE